jgi:hypothetical protein
VSPAPAKLLSCDFLAIPPAVTADTLLNLRIRQTVITEIKYDMLFLLGERLLSRELLNSAAAILVFYIANSMTSSHSNHA